MVADFPFEQDCHRAAWLAEHKDVRAGVRADPDVLGEAHPS
jgi:hypothetical protein